MSERAGSKLREQRVMSSILLISFLVASSFIALPKVPRVQAQPPAVTVQVWSWDYLSSDIVDTSLTPGKTFNLDVLVDNLPPIDNSSSGGIIAFDITLAYNSTVLKAADANIDPALCADNGFDQCLFQSSLHSPSAFPLHRDIDNPSGSTRLAYTLLANGNPPNFNRVGPCSPSGGACSAFGTLFRVAFQVVSQGFTSVHIVTSGTDPSVVAGPVGGAVTNLAFQSIDARFENRPPFQISADPFAAGIVPGESTSVNVTASQIWTIQNFTEGLHFAVSGLPAGAAATFKPVNSTGVLPLSTQLNITTSTTTPKGLSPLTITATSNITGVVRTASYMLIVGDIDIAVTQVTPTPMIVAPGGTVSVAVDAANLGVKAETFTVNLFVNMTQVGSQSLTLRAGDTQVVSLSWNTGGFTIGRYMITASIPPISGEPIVTNNNLTVGPVRINAPPTPAFTPPSTIPEAGHSVTFDASASIDTDGTIATYSWNFGDGATGTGKVVTHQFASGSYNVTLTVTDNDGAAKTVSHSLRVNAPPTPAFAPSTTMPQTGQTVTFDASGTVDSDGTIVSYSWDFGDGTTATGKIVSHQFTSTQSFTVKLTVTDNDGSTGTTSQTVTVTQAPTGTSFFTSAPFLAGIAVAALVLIGALLYVRSRRPRAAK